MKEVLHSGDLLMSADPMIDIARQTGAVQALTEVLEWGNEDGD